MQTLTEDYEFQHAFTMAWPYIAIYNNFEQFLWIASANDKSMVHLVRMPPDVIEIKTTKITATYELFILCRAVL